MRWMPPSRGSPTPTGSSAPNQRGSRTFDMAGINRSKQHPRECAAMVALDKEANAVVAQSGLSRLLAELVKIRVSQINGCAFCLRSTPARPSPWVRQVIVSACWPRGGSPSISRTRSEPLLPCRRTSPACLSRTPAGGTTGRAATGLRDHVVGHHLNAWNRIAIRSHYRGRAVRDRSLKWGARCQEDG